MRRQSSPGSGRYRWIGSLRKCWFSRPLVVTALEIASILALLLCLPVAGPRAYAQTQTTIIVDTGLQLYPYGPIDINEPPIDPIVIANPCRKIAGQIIQQLCAYVNPPGSLNPFVNATPPYAAIQAFEADTVRAYLAMHNLPPTDAPLVYESAGVDTRSEIRGLMAARILKIATGKPANAVEQSVYDWIKYEMWLFERTMYETAVADKSAWQSNPCSWRPDEDVADAYGLNYDGSKFCANNNSFATLISVPPQVPTKAYYLGAAQKKVYGKVFESQDNSAAMVKAVIDLALGGGTAALVSAGLGVGITQGASSIWAQSIGRKNFHKEGGTRLSFKDVSKLGRGGPVTVVFLMVLAGVEAGFKVFEYEKTLKELRDMDDEFKDLKEKGPFELNRYTGGAAVDLSSPGLKPGVLKLLQVLSALSLPDVLPTSLPSHNPLTDPVFYLTPSNTYPESLTYKDDTGATFSAKTFKGWFLRQCLTNCTGVAANALTPTLDIVDSSNTAWKVTRLGPLFGLVKQEVEAGDVLCQSLSSVANPSKCASYLTAAVPYLDAAGNAGTFSLVSAPAFTSASTAYFTQGVAGTFSITAAGAPTPFIFTSTAVLPPGFTLTQGTGTATLSYNGSSSTLPGTETILLGATNSGGTQQVLTIKVNGAPPEFTSSSVARFTKGVPGAFIVRATGNPPPVLTPGTPHFPPLGLDFVDNGDGTATISGTIPINSPGCGGSDCTGLINATVFGNVQTQQSLTIDVVSPVLPSLLPAQLEFTPGIRAEGKIIATGSTLGKISNVCNTPPGWLTFKDNGNNTATISGTPPLGAPPVGLLVIVSPPGVPVDYNCSGVFSSNYTVYMTNKLAFTTPDRTSFTVGSAGSFTVGGNAMDPVTMTGSLPAGVTFTSGLKQGTLSGIPAVGSGGAYPLVFTLGSGATAVKQEFTLIVKERPAFLEPSTATFTVNQPNSFPLTITAYPQTPLAGEEGLEVTIFTGSLPPGIRLVEALSTLGEPTGRWMLTGTPTATGQYKPVLAANNKVDLVRGREFTINVVPAPTVPKTTPVLTWTTPAAITYGSALSPTQLNARTDVPGTFIYAPPASTVLPVGSHTLSVTFVPTDSEHYNAATATQNITVNPAPAVPNGKPNLVLTYTLGRLDLPLGGPTIIIVQVRVANTGNAPAENVTLNSVKVGSAFGGPPQNLGTIQPGAATTAVFSVNGITSPTGTASSLSINGSYTGGTITSNARITLP